MKYHAFNSGSKGFIYFPETHDCYRVRIEWVDILKNEKYRSCKRKSDILSSFYQLQRPSGYMKANESNHERFSLFLNVATTCTMKCIYCFAAAGTYGKEEQIMPVRTAERAVKTFLDFVPSNEAALIIFFGGEPLLAWDAIQGAYYASTTHPTHGKRIKYHLVTNGTLLTKEVVDFLIHHGIDVVVSIDGGEIIQNSQRPLRTGKGSYEIVTKNLKYLIDKYPNLQARSTYVNFDYPLTKIYEELFSLGFRYVDAPPDILHLETRDISKLFSQLDRLKTQVIDFIQKNGYIGHTLFLSSIRRAYGAIKAHKDGCGAGHRIISIMPDGSIYPCHRYSAMSEFRLGNIDDKINSTYSFTANGKRLGCVNCWNRNICNGGCFYNSHVRVKNPLRPFRSWCVYSRKMSELTLDIIDCIGKPQIEKLLNLGSISKEIE